MFYNLLKKHKQIKNHDKSMKVFVMIFTIIFSISLLSVTFADTYNITNNYYGNATGYNSGYSSFSNYYISGYDRVCDRFYNGEAMMSRVPIIAGGDSYLCYIANGLTKPAYLSIEDWCNNNLSISNMQAFYLNSAYIESQQENLIVLMVNCAIQKKGVLDGYVEFRCTLDLTNNRFQWTKVRNAVKERNKTDSDYYYIP